MPPAAKCDFRACANAYRTFQESDCTYQPSDGPRRLCSKGVAVNVATGERDAAAPSNDSADAHARSEAQCNVNACAAAYGSFSAADCTYQPYGGPRRLCTK